MPVAIFKLGNHSNKHFNNYEHESLDVYFLLLTLCCRFLCFLMSGSLCTLIRLHSEKDFCVNEED